MAADDLRRRLSAPLVVWPLLAAAAVSIFAVLLWKHDVSRLLFGASLTLLLLGIGFFVVKPDFPHSADADDAEHPQLGEVLHAFLEALPNPVIALDSEGWVVAFNGHARELAPALRMGEPASIGLRIPELVEMVRRAVRTSSMGRVEFVSRVPTERWWEAVLIPAPAIEGMRKSLFLLTFHDLTPARRVEDMRTDFVANASHELRTPLAALSGFIETLKGAARNDPAARDRFLDIMEQQATRMARLIDDLLSLSRIELNAHRRPDKPVDLLALIRQVVDALQTLAKDRDLGVVITADPEPLVVPGDRDELIRVFENLIENALKYGASGKRVDITLKRVINEDGRSEAVVSVRDYGPGIPAEHLPRLTERFYRVDVAGSRALGGTGLGLALVKHIMNRHRGRLTIESKYSEGATFTVRLPMTGL